MNNLAIDHRLMPADEALAGSYRNDEREACVYDYRERDSLSENFINEIESWARHALSANGFADY